MGLVRVLQSFSCNYPFNAKPAVNLSAGTTGQVRIVAATVYNKSGGAIDLGLFRKFGPGGAGGSYQIFGTTTGGTVGTDLTAALNVGTASNIFTTTTNDGFAVSSPQLFGLVGFVCSQAQSGTPVYSYQYWNGAAWATLNTVAVPATYGTAAENLVVFAAPVDWATGGTGITNLPASNFNVRVRATTAGGQAVIATSGYVGAMIEYVPAVASNGSLVWSVGTKDIALVFQGQDGLLPYFGGSANAANYLTGQYWIVD